MSIFVSNIAAAALAVSVMGGSALAEPACQCTVSIEPEMLQSQSGLEKTYAAIEKKVDRACRRCSASNLSLRQRREGDACEAALMASILRQIRHGDLAALHGEAGPIRLSAN